MRIFTITCVFLFLMNVHVFCQEATISDHAVFRIEDRVFFQSDIEVSLVDLKNFSCLIPDSILLHSLEIDGNFFNRTWTKIKDDRLEKMIRLKKVQLTVEKRKVLLNNNGMEKEKLKKCLISDEKKLSRIKILVAMETFFLDRFSGRWEGSTGSDQGNKKEIIKESVKLYILTLDRKLDHHVYIKVKK